MPWRSVTRWMIAGLLLLAVLLASPVVGIETACRAPRQAALLQSEPFTIPDAHYRRPETDSYLSYPEWDIVYAYRDFAGVLQGGDEYRFGYARSVIGYWTSFCGANRVATSRGAIDPAEKIMLYVIGWSFTAEMAIKGGYEDTIGRLFAWLRGPQHSNEDLFALHIAEDYGAFLAQTPWYDYPFTEKIGLLWHQVPFDRSHASRAVERRIALTLEWGGKALYARAIRFMASLAPADLRIGSVVRGLTSADIAADPRIVRVRDLPDGLALTDTPRYAAFTDIVTGLARRGRQLVEIAGNHHVLITILAPPGDLITQDMPPVFVQPVQAKPGWRRVGLDVPVAELAARITALPARREVLEHIYDY